MKLILVPVGKQFKIGDDVFAHDLTNRNGGGKVAVRNVKTGEKTRIKADSEVDVIEETADTVKERNEKLKKEYKDGNKTERKQSSSGKVLPSFWESNSLPRKN